MLVASPLWRIVLCWKKTCIARLQMPLSLAHVFLGLTGHAPVLSRPNTAQVSDDLG
jgi:hypothetical protein